MSEECQRIINRKHDSAQTEEHKVQMEIQAVQLATVVKEDLNTPFSTPRGKKGHNSFPWIAPLYSQLIPYNAEC